MFFLDLRQDMLTLLSLRLMENVWKTSGLEYGVIPYRVLSTGPMLGLIEVVPNAETLGRIHHQRGGVFGVFKEDGLYRWLNEYSNSERYILLDLPIMVFIKNFHSSNLIIENLFIWNINLQTLILFLKILIVFISWYLTFHPITSRSNIAAYIDNFHKAMVGYSVAMYVLGVGDRHNDNIMLKKDTGQVNSFISHSVWVFLTHLTFLSRIFVFLFNP